MKIYIIVSYILQIISSQKYNFLYKTFLLFFLNSFYISFECINMGGVPSCTANIHLFDRKVSIFYHKCVFSFIAVSYFKSCCWQISSDWRRNLKCLIRATVLDKTEYLNHIFHWWGEIKIHKLYGRGEE